MNTAKCINLNYNCQLQNVVSYDAFVLDQPASHFNVYSKGKQNYVGPSP